MGVPLLQAPARASCNLYDVPVFLFSDIEGSTTRWEAKPEEMARALGGHDDLMRTAMEMHDGRVFKTVGDAFCVVFDSVDSALRAALHAQLNLSAIDWSEVEGLHVRMAVHAGEAVQRDGDYFGSTVNRVARLLSAANGGQILVSGAAADSATDASPEGISLRPLGTFQLKDLESPERIYQLVATGLPVEFKPLHTLDAIPNNLPIQGSGFVGREYDIAEIRKLLRESTLVTIAGPGGVGKTRIALQCAADRMDRMTNGVWFVNLAPIQDGALIPNTILSTAGGTPGDAGNALTALVDFLKTRRMLIVLDNCEHLVQEAAWVAGAILSQCPSVTILATSREPLRIEGERVYRLSPLRQEDALALFVQRASAVSPSFTLSDDNRQYVRAICEHLDGMPLAVELAAARVYALTPKELEQRLHDRFRLLRAGSRTADARQQTLQALIDWSHDLLNASEKTLFRRLAVFRGTFSLDAASAVCSDEMLDEWEILDLLASLTDKSLIVAQHDGDASRYYLLESLREYASAKLKAAGETTAVEERHAEYFAGVSREASIQFDSQPPADWLENLARDLDNFRAALGWSLVEGNSPSLGAQLAADDAPMFLRLGLFSEGSSWCQCALDQTQTPSDVRARLNYAQSMLYTNKGDYTVAMQYAEKALELYRQGDYERGLIKALSQVAQLHPRTGHAELAQPFIDEAVQRARVAGDRHLLILVLRRCANGLPAERIEDARAKFQEANEISAQIGSTAEACLTDLSWAEAEAEAGCYARAMEISLRALDFADEDSRMYLCGNIAAYAASLGDLEAAESYGKQALDLALERNHEIIAAHGMAYSAIGVARDNPAEAVRILSFALTQLQKLGWVGGQADRFALEHVAAELRERIGNGEYQNLFEKGRKLAPSEALSILSNPSVSAGQRS